MWTVDGKEGDEEDIVKIGSESKKVGVRSTDSGRMCGLAT